ncbi:MAG: hypothetical protein ACK4L4_20000, partial [Gemmobacter sp.]
MRKTNTLQERPVLRRSMLATMTAPVAVAPRTLQAPMALQAMPWQRDETAPRIPGSDDTDDDDEGMERRDAGLMSGAGDQGEPAGDSDEGGARSSHYATAPATRTCTC